MPLNCHSYHSLRYGTIPVTDLVDLAVMNQCKVLALTDINTITGIYEFFQYCKKQNIKPIVGIDFRINATQQFIGLAKNREGIAEMNRFLTHYNLQKKEIPNRAPDFQNSYVIYPLDNVPSNLLENEFIGITAEQIPKLYNSLWKRRTDKMVILQTVSFRNKKEYNLHKILRAIDMNCIGSKLTQNDYAFPSEIMVSQDEIAAKFKQYPQIIKNTEEIKQHCNFDFDFNTPKNKKNYTNSKEEDIKLLTKLAFEGMNKRYGSNNPEAIARIEKELKVIIDLDFCGYFLITWDIINYSLNQGFLHVGRGSGANSIVAYCLKVTDICPLELDLYFERFLNVNRKTPPDFDIDWSWKERDTILNYIFNKYGRNHVAFCGTNVEFKYRSIYREIGKVFGLPKEELDEIANNRQNKLKDTKLIQMMQEYGKMVEKFPNQRSMHSCGIIISEEPITNFTSLEMPPKGFPIVQFDMHVAENIGFEKFDILSQRGIGNIDEAVKLIKQNRNIHIDIKDTSLSINESKCNELLSQGKTLGCFYIESPAMRGLLRRLKCDNYKVLVAASSIIRPGVAKSGMMKEYIFRHNNPTQFQYFHEVFKQQLGETYGIMVYQEDVIKIALHYGGLPAADGDILRRAMSGKTRSKEALQKVKDNFFESCKQKGHPEQLSEEIYRQIESFAGYSFCKSHSASYAVESYQSLYLKAYYPLEYMTAVINNFGGFYRTEIYIHEARMLGAKIHAPCINTSEEKTTLHGKDLYLGFQHLKSLESKTAHAIVKERTANGPFSSLEEFINRVPIGIESLQILIFIGAFKCTGKQKNELLIKARLIKINYNPNKAAPLLLQEPVKEFKLPVLERSPFEDAFDEIELLDFSISVTPFNLLKTKYRGTVMACDLVKHHRQTIKMLAYLIARKQVPTKRGDMFFGTWIDANGEYFDTAHFPDSLTNYPFKGGGCYLLLGKVEIDFHFPTITIEKMSKMPFIPDPRYADTDERRFRTEQFIKEDVSLTSRAPYPQTNEYNLPRQVMTTQL